MLKIDCDRLKKEMNWCVSLLQTTFYNDKFMKFCKKNVCKKICVHERSKNPVFPWQEYYDVVTITKYTTYILTWFPEKNHVNLWNNIELWIYAVYLIIENEKIEKKHKIYYILL